MAFRETVVREGQHPLVDPLGQLTGDALGRHSLEQPPPKPLHPFLGTLGPHRPPQLVRLRRGKPRDIDSQLHQLLLEQRHAESLFQGTGHRRVLEVPLLQAVAAPDVRVHRTALDRARPDQRHLDHEIVELSRFQPRQRGQLRPALHLEHPDRIGPPQHLVHRVVVQVELADVDLDPVVLKGHVDRVVQRREHAETQQVELDQSDLSAVVLVPLQDGTAGHPRPFHRANLADRLVTDHHPAGVDA